MYSREEMKRLLTERDQLDFYNEWRLHEIWEEMVALLQTKEDLDAFADYMLEEMTQNECETLEEIIDEIRVDIATKKFADALEIVVNKYPYNSPTATEEWEQDRFLRRMLRAYRKELAERGEL